MPPTQELERDLETFFYRRVRSVGGLTFKFAPTHAGAPDRVVLLPGGVIQLVELKTATGKLSPIQVVWHERAARLGVGVTVLKGIEEIRDWTRNILDAAWLKDHPGWGKGKGTVDDMDEE